MDEPDLAPPRNPYGPAPKVELHDVEWRIDGKPVERDGTHRARYVPYVDARWVAEALDRWVGPGNWTRSDIPGTSHGKETDVCTVSIWFPGQGWVSKDDIGFNDGMPAVAIKGTWSDAFKRSAIGMWGVGRNIYDLPGDIWAEVKMSNGKAYPHPNARLQLEAELRRRGHEITQVRTNEAGELEQVAPRMQGDRVSADTDVAEPPDTITAEQADEIRNLITGIADPDARERAMTSFRADFGRPADILADRHEDALQEALRLSQEARSPAVAAGTDDAPAESEDGDGPPSEPTSGTPTPPGGPAVGLTDDDIDKMTVRGLNETLAQFDLPVGGTKTEMRQRLKDARESGPSPRAETPAPTMALWEAGAVLSAHPVTGETLSPVAAYVEGIEGYEETVEDLAPFYEWYDRNHGATPYTDLSQYDAFLVWNAIHHLHTHGRMP